MHPCAARPSVDNDAIVGQDEGESVGHDRAYEHGARPANAAELVLRCGARCRGVAWHSVRARRRLSERRRTAEIRVTPAVAQPPAFVTVRADVEAHDDNRSLEVTAEADDFRASRQLPLEGSKGPRFTEIYFDNLPAGAYTVTVVLNGSSGQRARVTQSVLVGSPPDGPQP